MAPRQTRNLLLETATDLFWRHSFSAVSVDEICKLAGVNKGSFYHYFQSKFDLMAAVCDNLWETTRPELDAIFAPAADIDTRIRRLCELIYAKQAEKAEQFGQVLGCPFTTCASDLCMQDDGFRDQVNTMFGRFMAYFEALVAEAHAQGHARDLTVSEGAQALFCYKTGVLSQARMFNDLSIIARDLEAGFRRYLRLPDAPAAAPEASAPEPALSSL